jgi:RNA polymerase sigma-70 factor, ECF subfamily
VADSFSRPFVPRRISGRSVDAASIVSAVSADGLRAGVSPRRSRIAVRAVTDRLEDHRGELTAFCRRMLGPFDAEDAVQETLARALNAADQFQARGTLQAWLYRIAGHVCIDMLESRRRRELPMDLGPACEALTDASRAPAGVVRIESRHGRVVIGAHDGPAEISESREAVERALAAAVRYLTPRQRGVLMLREVLRWNAREAAELLGTSVPSVNSTLQRARATLRSRALTADVPIRVDEAEREVLRRFVRAFERSDVAGLTQLVREEVGTYGRVATSRMTPRPQRDVQSIADAA